MKPIYKITTLIAVAVLLAIALTMSARVNAQAAPAPAAPASPAPAPAAAPAAPQAASAPVVDPKAAEVLHKITDYFKTTKNATAQIDTAMKFEGGGHSQQMSSSAKLAVERPNKLSLIVKEQQSGGGSAVSDGKTLWLDIAALKKYSEQAAPATLDEIIESPVAALAQHSGIALILFDSNAYNKLLEGASKLTYVGQDDIDGAKCDHVHVEQQQLDYDIWSVAPVTPTDHPVLRRVKPDFSRQIKQVAMQNPQMKDAKLDGSVEFTAWKIDQPVEAAQFAFTPTAGSEKVESMDDLMAGDEPALKLKGKPAPDFSIDLLGGGKTTLAEHKDKDVVILDFWATWCGPCVQALPIVTQVAKDYAAKGVVFYAVNQQEDAATIEPFLKDHKLDIKVALDKDGAVGGAFRVTGIPQTVIIGKDGLVKVVHIGASPTLKADLSRDLDKVLAAQPAAPAAPPAK